MSFFDQHDPGCSPVNACSRCEFYRLLMEAVPNINSRIRILHYVDKYVDRTLNEGSPTQVDDRSALLDAADIGLNLSTRTANALRNHNVKTLRQLVQMSEKALLHLPNFGRMCLSEIKYELSLHNLRLGMSVEDLPPEP